MVLIWSKIREFRLFNLVELDWVLMSRDEGEMGDGFFEVIEELERMIWELLDIFEEMNEWLFVCEL